MLDITVSGIYASNLARLLVASEPRHSLGVDGNPLIAVTC